MLSKNGVLAFCPGWFFLPLFYDLVLAMFKIFCIWVGLSLFFFDVKANERVYELSYKHPITGQDIVARLSKTVNEYFPFLLSGGNDEDRYVSSITPIIHQGGFAGFSITMIVDGFTESISGRVREIIEFNPVSEGWESRSFAQEARAPFASLLDRSP